jgi:hypothetical protein
VDLLECLGLFWFWFDLGVWMLSSDGKLAFPREETAGPRIGV